jgi:hypothetical protein
VEERGERVSELKVMGVFVTCGVLATLGWGGVTSTLMILFRVDPARRLAQCGSVSTSTSELAPGNEQAPPKATALSFRDELVRMEWPRRGTPLNKEH